VVHAYYWNDINHHCPRYVSHTTQEQHSVTLHYNLLVRIHTRVLGSTTTSEESTVHTSVCTKHNDTSPIACALLKL